MSDGQLHEISHMLGRIEQKIDGIVAQKLDERITGLERLKAYALGLVAAVTAGLSALWELISHVFIRGG